jgi:glycosyltransferase involved in cell wall biosynthesis
MYQISIIMPSFNQGDYIEAAINSVLSQDGVSCQLIVMDGGSSDCTREVLDKYKDQIYFEIAADRGQAHALNKALALAKAPIVGWLNSDDLYLPNAFKIVLHAFKTHNDISLIYGQRVLINESSEVVGWVRPGPFRIDSDVYNICSETSFWRRECMPSHAFREELRFAMDVHFLGAMAKTVKHLYLEKYLGCFRCHSMSKSSTLWEEYAIPESTNIWRELFQREINHHPVSNDSALSKLLEKVFGLISLPLPMMVSYIMHRLSRDHF